MSAGSRLPVLARVLLRLVPGRGERERAEADLADVFAGVAPVRGRRAARWACVREAWWIVLWSLVDRGRRRLERRPRGAAVERRTSVLDFVRDVRLSARSLSRRPGFAAVVVLVLALGIGANTAVFTLAKRLFLDPPGGVARPEELVRLFRATESFAGGSLSYPDYVDYRDGAPSLAGLAASSGSNFVTAARWGASGHADVRVALVTHDWFDVLGVRPAAGRLFRAEENRVPDGHAVAVLSWGFWQSRFGADPGVVGREIALNGRAFTVVGIVPRAYSGFQPGAETADVYAPIMMRSAIAPTSDTAWRERMPNLRSNWLMVVGRLRRDATVERAQAELSAVAARIYGEEPEAQRQAVHVQHELRWSPEVSRSLGDLTRLLAAAVAVLLAVAVVNAAILLLARGSGRDRELGVRVALGAGRARVLWHLMLESLLLAGIGAGVGVVLSMAAVRVVAPILPVRLDPLPAPDARVLLAALAASVLVAVVAAIPLALRAGRADPTGLIQGRTNSGRSSRMQDGLVVAQVALSLVLVTGAVLFARSLTRARAVDLGFETRNTLLVRLNLAPRGYDAERGRVLLREVVARVQRIPGVTGASLATHTAFRGEWSTVLHAWPGARFAGAQEMDVGLNAVGPEYFAVLRIPILRGRPFQPQDQPGTSLAAVVNETFARLVFPDGDALGRDVPLSGPDQPAVTIVGVVRDATYYEFGESPRAMVYGSIFQVWQPTVTVVVKTTDEPLALASAVRDIVHGLDPDLPIASLESMHEVYQQQLASWRTSAHVVGSAGLIALLLASAGLYGVMAYRVARRTQEIGLRMALGETTHGIAARVLGRGLRLTGLGVLIGLGGALMLGPSVQRLLFGVPARDPFTLLAAPLVLSVVAVAAALVPARRAMSIDPIRAMRTE